MYKRQERKCILMKTIGEKINTLRKQRNMTQDELAEKMGVSSQAVSKWEKDMSIPDLPVLIELSDFFHISLDELVKEKEDSVQDVYKRQIQRRNSMISGRTMGFYRVCPQ